MNADPVLLYAAYFCLLLIGVCAAYLPILIFKLIWGPTQMHEED